MKVVINADDFGCSVTINEAIRTLLNSRKITSATIMVNGPAFQDAASCVRNYSTCSFGVHLNLTSFQSLTNSQVFHDAGIVNEAGVFKGNLRSIHPSIPLAGAIEREWVEQITMALDYNLPVSHLDSHHHVHTIPWLFIPLKRVQKKFGIRKVRATMNWYDRNEPLPSGLLLFAKIVWNWSLKHIYATKITDYFTSFQCFFSDVGYGEKRARGVVELMCHPGHPLSSVETDLLQSNWPQMLPFKTELISYNNL